MVWSPVSRISLALVAALVMPVVRAQSDSAPASPAQQPAPGAGVTTIRTRSDLVVVDVVVADSRQSPLHGLKVTDFTLLENGVPQHVKSFEEHTALSAADAAKLPPTPKMPPGIFTNFAPASASGTVNVLLLDALNTPMKDQAYVRSQLLDYLKKAPAGNRIAIFGLTSRLVMLQGFTSDPEILRNAVLHKAGPGASPLLADASGGIAPESLSDSLADSGMGNDPSSAAVLANLQQFEAQQESFQLQLRAQYTLDAMNQLARYLVSIPGRKNLIWFSGSFPISILPNADLPDPFAIVANSTDEFRETTNLLTRSQVAVYPVDARGLMTSPMFDASVSGAKYARNPQAMNKDQAKFFSDTAGEHSTMFQMASETGGQAFVNTNGLSDAVGKAIESGSNYYTLSYSPSDTNWNGKYRKIQVKLPQPGLTLTYRHGYYSDDPEAKPKKGAETAATAPKPASSIKIAMMRGAPGPTEILFKVRILPASTDTETNPAPGNRISADPKVNAKGPYRRYLLDFAADPRAVRFTPSADGRYHGTVEFLAFVYDRDGQLIDTIGATSHASLPAASYRQMMEVGIPFHLEVSVPAKGEFFLRTAIHDVEADHFGAVEVPISSVAQLAPLPAAPPPPQAK